MKKKAVKKKAVKKKAVKEKPVMRKGKSTVTIDKFEWDCYLDLKKDMGSGVYKEFLDWKLDYIIKPQVEEDSAKELEDWEGEVGGSEPIKPLALDIVYHYKKLVILKDPKTRFLYGLGRNFELVLLGTYEEAYE